MAQRGETGRPVQGSASRISWALISVLLVAVGSPVVGSGHRDLFGLLNVLDIKKYPNARCLDGTPGGFYLNLAHKSRHVRKPLPSNPEIF